MCLHKLNSIKYTMKLTFFFFAFFVTSSFAFAQNDAQKLAMARAYYENGECEKAMSIYEKLIKNQRFIFQVHPNYYGCLLQTEQFEEAEKYLEKNIRRYKIQPTFHIDYVLLLRRLKREDEADKHLRKYLREIRDMDGQVRATGSQLVRQGLYTYAEELYLYARENGNHHFVYSLANLYAQSGETEKMIDEYLKLLELEPHRIQYVKQVLQSQIRDERDWKYLEPLLFERIRKSPDNMEYTEMLIWYYLQQKDFFKAFIQARAIDKRLQLGGLRIDEIGQLAFENGDYKQAEKIYAYLVENYADRPEVPYYQLQKMRAKEEVVRNTFPVEKSEIQELISEYQAYLTRYGITPMTAASAQRMARLKAFYLEERDTATQILETLVNTPGLSMPFIASAKLDLGDIYLLKGEWWEATLIYSQVEKARKDTPQAYDAKLRNARLHYYNGNFELAKAHLDILKLATSREIANDAMDLSVLIQANTGLDSTELAMQTYASVELLVYQQQFQEAIEEYEAMLEDFEDHSLTDEILWAQAQLYFQLGDYEKTIAKLERLLGDHKEDILGDDANFMLGNLYEEKKKDKEKAMEIYKNHLLDFPGSIYTAEARKRFRQLREGAAAGS